MICKINELIVLIDVFTGVYIGEYAITIKIEFFFLSNYY